MRTPTLVISALAASCFATSAWSAIAFNGSSGNLAAQATFDIVGGKLQVVLSNTSAFDVLVPADILTGVFFNVTGGSSQITSSFSAISGGATFLNGVQVLAANSVVGGEWAFSNAAAIGAAVAGTNAGISSSGLGLFGGPTFPGPNLGGPAAVDGMQYGITSAGDNLATQNGGVAGNEITKSSVTFLLDIAPSFNLSKIGNVQFQYGTDLSEPRFPGFGGGSPVPEPATLALAALGLLAATARRRRA